MDIVKTFGQQVGSLAQTNPQRARRLLLAGYHAQNVKLKMLGDRKLPPSRRSVAHAAMELVIDALEHPSSSAAVSLFTPCEPLFAAHITPYSVETISAFLAGTQCEHFFLQRATDEGLPETMCSYHRTFLGALETGLLPRPSFTVYTNLACDGNLITFPFVQQHFDIPGFCIDVPYAKTQDSVDDVAQQIKSMVDFVQDVTGTRITFDELRQRVACGQRASKQYLDYLDAMRTRYLASDMTSEMYAVLTNHVLLGSDEEETFTRMLKADAEKAGTHEHKRLLWLHLIPNMQPAVCAQLDFHDDISIVACDLAVDPLLIEVDPDKPYDAMARRLVYSAFNGAIDTRIQRALQLAERTHADGAVLFAQWGCKSTLGATLLMKQKLEENGLPCLVLDGDGCDRANASDGQTATRLGAFLEMLEDNAKRKDVVFA